MALIKWNRPLPSNWASVFDDDMFNWPVLTTVDKGLDIYETNDAIVAKAALPGVPEDKVEVTVEGNVLTISGSFEETQEEKDEKKAVYKSNRQTSFSYSTSLPRMVDSSQATAEVKDGVVTVRVPKTEAEKPKSIKVSKAK